MIRMSESEMAGLFDRRDVKLPGLRESDIQRHVMQYLRMKGWFVVKIHQSLGSHKGIADLFALKNGKSVWIEVKTLKGRQSKHQMDFERDVLSHGGSYLVARGISDVEGI